MQARAVPSESPAAVSSKEDADLSAAFGPLFGALLKELLTKIVPAETAVLEGVVGQCSSLAHLDVSFNAIREKGAVQLAGVLGQCPSLAHLDLGFNSPRGEGAEKLAEVLHQ